MMRKIAIGLVAAALVTGASTLSASAIPGGGRADLAIHGGGDGGGGAYVDLARFGGGGFGRGGFGRGGFGRGGFGRGFGVHGRGFGFGHRHFGFGRGFGRGHFGFCR